MPVPKVLKIRFLAHVINATGSRADPHKIEAIQKIRELENLIRAENILRLGDIADLTKPL